MAKLSFKKIFNALGNLIEDVVSSHDLPTLSDKFALAAFKKEGYEVLGRENFAFTPQQIPQVLVPAEATYRLSKDNKEYIGTVEGFGVLATGRFGEPAYSPRIHSIKSITPKS